MDQAVKDQKEILLRNCLRFAVPMWVEKVLHYPDELVRDRQRICSQIVASQGDILLYGGNPGGAAYVFNHLAEGIAILSVIAKGGVEIFGMRWDTDPGTGKLSVERAEGS